MTISRALSSAYKSFASQIESAYAIGGDINNATIEHALDATTIDLQERADLENKESVPDGVANSPFKGKLNPAKWTAESLIGLASGPATKASFDDLIECAMLGAPYLTPAGVTTLAGSTKTTLNVGAAHGLLLGDIIMIGMEAVSVRAAGASSVTVDPPLSAAPGNGTAIKQLKQYPLDTAYKTMVRHAYRDLMAMRADGCTVGSFKLDVPGKELAKMTASGEAGYVTTMQATRLATAINTSVASASASFTPEHKGFLAVGMRINIGAEKNDLVTAVNETTGEVTIMRSNVGVATHAIGTEITPYWPALPATIKTVAQGKSMTIRMLEPGATDAVTAHALNFAFEMNTGLSQFTDESGYDGPSDVDVDKKTGKITVKTIFHQPDYTRVVNAGKDVTFSVICVIATSDNAHGLVFYANKCSLKTKLDTSGKTLKHDLEFAIGRSVDASGNDVINEAWRIARF
ncbi:MAG: hypothetical protein HZB29_09795 [Nitrospinae bacterium]|nr:hypothetical protein [Nitrospinota bacterium]